MSQSVSEIADTLQSAYDELYTEEMTEWRELGGRFKAQNILDVCAGHSFSRVLECGAGEGSILKFLDACGAFPELHAVEISDTGIEKIRRRNLRSVRQVQKFNGYEIPYSNGTFDMAYCSHVIEHVEHPRLLLRELRRVSRFQVFEIPLDYSVDVDAKVQHFLSYGHINIFTPSLFKFLLRSEGFDVLAETRTHASSEVIRFNWYRNLKLKRTFARDLALKMYPLRNVLRRIWMGRSGFNERGFAAYTCLARGAGELKVF